MHKIPPLPSLSFHPTVLTQDDPVLCYEAPSRPVGCFPSFRYCGLWFAFLLLSRPRVSVTIDASMSTLYFSGRQYVIRRLNPNNPDLCTAMLDYVASTAMSRFIFQFGADVFPYQNPCNDARVNS